MMKEYKGEVVHVYRPAPKVRRSVRRTTTLPRLAQVTVRLDNAETRILSEPVGVSLMRGDPVTLHADLTPGGTIGPLRKDDN